MFLASYSLAHYAQLRRDVGGLVQLENLVTSIRGIPGVYSGISPPEDASWAPPLSLSRRWGPLTIAKSLLVNAISIVPCQLAPVLMIMEQVFGVTSIAKFVVKWRYRLCMSNKENRSLLAVKEGTQRRTRLATCSRRSPTSCTRS